MNPSLVRKIWISFAWRFVLWAWFNIMVIGWIYEFLAPRIFVSSVPPKWLHPLLNAAIILFTSYWSLRWALNARIKHINEAA